MENQRKKFNIFEKTTFVVGLLILALLVGYLSYQWATKKEKSPSLEVTTSFDPSFDLNTYEVSAKNSGNGTAKSVNINFNLYQEGILAESAVLEIDYIPDRSNEKGWVSFSKARKSNDSLSIGAITYLKP
jgi:uncharacterized protein (TIGR02588 family)